MKKAILVHTALTLCSLGTYAQIIDLDSNNVANSAIKGTQHASVLARLEGGFTYHAYEYWLTADEVIDTTKTSLRVLTESGDIRLTLNNPIASQALPRPVNSQADNGVISVGGVANPEGSWVNNDRRLEYHEFNSTSGVITKSHIWPDVVFPAYEDWIHDCYDCTTVVGDTMYTLLRANNPSSAEADWIAQLHVADISTGELIRSFEYRPTDPDDRSWPEGRTNLLFHSGLLYTGVGHLLFAIDPVTGTYDPTPVKELLPLAPLTEIDTTEVTPYFAGFGTNDPYYLKYGSYHYLAISQLLHNPYDQRIDLLADRTGIALCKVDFDSLNVIDSVVVSQEVNSNPGGLRIGNFKTPFSPDRAIAPCSYPC